MATIDTPVLVTGIHPATLPHGPWRVRVIFEGSNPDNVSGLSSKFWQVTGSGARSTVEVRWGKIGAKGQAQSADLHDARARLSEKLRKGYTMDSDAHARTVANGIADTFRRPAPVAVAPVPRAPVQRTLAERLGAARWTSVRVLDDLLTAAAALGWVAIEVDEAPTATKLFVGRDGALWAARVEGALAYGQVPR